MNKYDDWKEWAGVEEKSEAEEAFNEVFGTETTEEEKTNSGEPTQKQREEADEAFKKLFNLQNS